MVAVISYVRGDATNPLGKGPKCIVHIVNDIGKWGKGFVMALSKKWPNTRKEYLAWYNTEEFALGKVQVIEVQANIFVVNMVAQHGVGLGSNGPPIRYEALEKCLTEVAEAAKSQNWSVHMPRIGCGLAGGKWERVEPIIEQTLKGLHVMVYDF